MSTAVWLSTNVVNISVPLAGMVELRKMIFDIAPPIVSMPSESGVTSSSSMSRLPLIMMWAWIAAPTATTSSGFSSACGGRRNSSSTDRRTSGMRVDPPTSTASSICDGSTPASASASRHGSSVRSTTGRTIRSNSRRESRRSKSGAADAGTAGSATRMTVSSRSDRSHFAWITARRTAWSLAGSIGDARSASPSTSATSNWSMSSPPSWVSPLVASTWKTPSSTRRMEMSNVPPPKS
jgi:hypothetical protein